MTDAETTIHTADGREIDATTDPEAVDTYATGLTVSLERTISTGDFESAKPFASIRAEVRPALSVDDNGNIDALREQAERLKRVVAWQVSAEEERFRNGGER